MRARSVSRSWACCCSPLSEALGVGDSGRGGLGAAACGVWTGRATEGAVHCRAATVGAATVGAATAGAATVEPRLAAPLGNEMERHDRREGYDGDQHDAPRRARVSVTSFNMSSLLLSTDADGEEPPRGEHRCGVRIRPAAPASVRSRVERRPAPDDQRSHAASRSAAYSRAANRASG
jgi:hypothetical protein